MAAGWQTYVYRTDGERTYCGFFNNAADANRWIKKQKEGTYEVSTKRPPRKKEGK